MLTGAPGLPQAAVAPWPAQAAVAAGRRELLRALGALVTDPPARTSAVADSLGLASLTVAEHTELFVLSLPPYASVHLSPDGKLGGEAADRVAGIWRVLGLAPPASPDHLGAILALYAELGDAAAIARARRTAARLERAREAVLWEHLWPWLPGYLAAAAAESAAARPWADLMRRALTAEARLSRQPAGPPLALRAAPEPLGGSVGFQQLLDHLTARMRTGCVLTFGAVAAGARQLGLGLRRGERRFALRAMMEQDPAATLRWLAGQAEVWTARYRLEPDFGGGTARWWALRAAAAGRYLAEAAASNN